MTAKSHDGDTSWTKDPSSGKIPRYHQLYSMNDLPSENGWKRNNNHSVVSNGVGVGNGTMDDDKRYTVFCRGGSLPTPTPLSTSCYHS